MSNQPLTRNITATFRLATDGDRALGHGWYGRARDLAERLDPENVERAAGVIAALSPRLSWRKNVEYAELAYYLHATNPFDDPDSDVAINWFAGSVPTLNANAKKAARILNGHHPENILGGPKVTAFYWTIVNPDDPRSVVVDRHAISILFNRPLSDDEVGQALRKKGAYELAADLYRRAAAIISRELGEIWTPAQVQAATWTYWRRERAVAYHGEA